MSSRIPRAPRSASTTPFAGRRRSPLTLPEGSHTLVVQRGSERQAAERRDRREARRRRITSRGPSPHPQSPPLQTGSLSVVSDPPGSAVIVDGTARGQTPLTIRDLSAGRHDVLVRECRAPRISDPCRSKPARRRPWSSAAHRAATPSWGWITLRTPFPVQVLEAGRVVGTSEIDRIMLSPGNHELDFVADSVRFPAELAGQYFGGTRSPRLAYNSSRGHEHQRPAVGGGFHRRHADRRYSAGQRDADDWRS